ncbi:hypothetical protein [Sulfuricurvum sp.]|uniref:hypothetical protein n=1 Tax=Sulfuricurvum sp. TaxID=2025608 RepID=UPI003BAE7FEC
MLDFPLHPTLFISLAILVGFAISPLLAYVDNKSAIENNTSNANNLLNATWWLAAAFGISLLVIYNTKEAIEAKETVMALAPLGMMIAAMIASASVLKNIAETKANEIKKHEKEDSKFYLEKCLGYLEDVYKLLGKRQNDVFAWKQASDILINMRTVSSYIVEESHKNIFQLEYSKYVLRLYSSFANSTKEDGLPPIKSSFFCSINTWATDDLATAFLNTTKIRPEDILPVLQFAQYKNNTFISSPMDYKNWRSINLDAIEDLPMRTAVEYLKMYKEKIQEKPKDPS